MKKYLFGILSFVFLALGTFFGGSLLSPNISAYAQDEIVVPVGSAKDFVKTFLAQSTYNNEAITIKLTAPIDFTNVDLSPLTQGKNVFMGTFDGNGYSVSNLTLKSSILYYGLIPYAKNATIKNLKVEGDVEFEFDSETLQEIYAGIILGYGENVVIENCELDNAIINLEDQKVSYDDVAIPVNSNINFGFLAGKLKGNPNASSQTDPANIKNCANYYDANVVVNSFSSLNAGGLVGSMENCFMHNCMNYGNITYSKNLSLLGTSENNQCFGGLVGEIKGSGINIRNNIFGGTISSYEDITGLNNVVGAIFGSSTSTGVEPLNINYDYYLQEGISPSGDGYVEKSNTLNRVADVNKTFLSTAENFDQSLESWDFDKVWIMSKSRFHIQNFQIFHYDFNSVLDRGHILQGAEFMIEGSDVGSESFDARYGMKLRIRLAFKHDYLGFYCINENNPFMLLNNNQYQGEYELVEIKDGENVITGYIITVEANATTAGTYSFVISPKTYNCQIAVSEEAVSLSQGGVRVVSNTIQSTPSPEFGMTFAHNSEAKQVVAESPKGSIYSFDHWKLYYKDENGEFSGEPVQFANAYDSVVTIAFGSAPFNREFKLVAYFTDKDAITFDLGEINQNLIKSVKICDEEYVVGSPVQVSPSRVVNIEIVVAKDYLLNVEPIKTYIAELYGDNPSPYPIEKEMTIDSNGDKTYFLTIDLNYAGKNIDDNEVNLELYAEKDTSNDNSDLLWLIITLPIVAVLGIGLAIFFIVRRKRGGGRASGSGKSSKKEKKVSYKDYY